MHQLPTLEEIAAKLEDVIAEHVDFERPADPRAALVADLGFDSLDLTEAGFCIQEYFDFEFSDKNVFDELDKVLGGGVVVREGKLTELGRDILKERMPELADADLPEQLSPLDLQKYVSLISFARLIQEFLAAAPDTCSDTGEAVTLVDMVPRTSSGGKPAGIPKGDTLLAAWVDAAAARVRARA